MEKEICDERSQRKLHEEEQLEKKQLAGEAEKQNPYSKENLNKLSDDSYMPDAESIEEHTEDLNDTVENVGGWGGI